MYKLFIEIDEIVLEMIKLEKIQLGQLVLIGIIQFEEENFSCIISKEKIYKSIYLEKEIYFQIFLMAKDKSIPFESLLGDLVLNSYLFLVQNG